jgi:transposase
VAFDPKHLPEDPQVLRQIVLDLMAQLDRESTERNKIEALLRELLDARRSRKSEQLSTDQLALFAATWEARQAETEPSKPDASGDDDSNANPGAGESSSKKRGGGRQALPRHLKRERIVHDLAEAEKHCSACRQDLRLIGEESSERYEYIPAQLTVIEDVCKKYACACTVKTATKPSQPIEKSTAGASLLAQVIVAKTADHLPLHRQEKIFQRHGVNISRKTIEDHRVVCIAAIRPDASGARERQLYVSTFTLVSSVPITLDYTATRERAGPEEFLKGYRGYLQADAYGGYDAFFKDPARGLTEVGCLAHARRYFHKALDSDQARMGPALLLIAQLYRVEKEARPLTAEGRLRLRQLRSRPILEKLRNYLLEIQAEILPKSPEGRAVRYTLKNWTALTRYCEDGDLPIDNNATERAIRGVAVGRNNWVFFGSDEGGKTAAVPRSFVASCQRVGVDPFVWLKDILSRIADHPITRIAELLPNNWAPAKA